MKIETILEKIENKTVTPNDFNLLIEAKAGNAEERVMRRMRPKREQETETSLSPASKVKIPGHKGDYDPTRTGIGKRAVERQGEENKDNADEFRTSVEFINNNFGKPIAECDFNSVSNLNDLNIVVRRLLTTPSKGIPFEWLHQIREHIENGRG